MRCASRKVLVSSLRKAPHIITLGLIPGPALCAHGEPTSHRLNKQIPRAEGGCPCNMLGVQHGASFHSGPSHLQRECINTRDHAALARKHIAVTHLASITTELSKPSVSTPSADSGGLGWAAEACPLGSLSTMGTQRTSSQPCLVQASFRSLYFPSLQGKNKAYLTLPEITLCLLPSNVAVCTGILS